MADDEKDYRFIKFTGKREDFPCWEEWLLARAAKKGYKKVLSGDEETPTFGEDYDDSEAPSESVLKTIHRNQQAYSDMISSIDVRTEGGKTAFQLVRKTRDDKFPDGNTHQALENLKYKHLPSSNVAKGKMIRTYQNARLKPGASAENFVTMMEGYRADLAEVGEQCSEESFLHQIVNNLGQEFVELSQTLARQIGKEEDPLTVEKLRDEVSSYQERREETREKSRFYRRSPEAALVGYSKPFKGLCNKCGMRGHKGADCRRNMDRNCLLYTSPSPRDRG